MAMTKGCLSMKELTEKLLKAQEELKAPKGQYNSFGKYKYRSAEDILEAVKPINVRNGILLTITDEPILIGEWHYIKATATVTDGTDNLTVTAYARESETKKGQDLSQITGTASSYARKYALNGLYLIDDTKDADTDEYRNQGNKALKSATQAEIGNLKKEIIAFSNLMKEQGKDVKPEQVEQTLNITDYAKLNSEDVKEAVNKLKGWSK